MHYYLIAPTKIVRQDSELLTYHSDILLTIGTIVSIPVGSKTLVGVVVEQTDKPSYVTKSILSIIEDRPLPIHLIETAKWMASYYHTHLAVVFQNILPSGIQKSRRQTPDKPIVSVRNRVNIVLNSDQVSAIESVEDGSNGTFLLHGITGSGKTQVYIELAKKTIERGNSVIIIVPEIALTAQLVDEFLQHFDNIYITHSQQTESQRHTTWKKLLNSDRPSVVVGPRSALFAPLMSLGLIIIDEAHEPSLRQDKSPKYSALRTASVISSNTSGKLVLGSATPQVTEYYLAGENKRPLIELSKPARKDVQKSNISIVDMKDRQSFQKSRILSTDLIDAIERSLKNNEQVLLFHNRRGSASSTLCQACGWMATDPSTNLPLTLHADKYTLVSHISGETWPVPSHCPECGGVDIIHKGIGTKLIENEVRKLFPNSRISRFDSDTPSDSTLSKVYKELYDGTIDIIIGTQVVAKGLDLPNLRTVGLVQADSGLMLPDFASTERVFQLVAQTVGRVGRDSHDTTVIIQSYHPNHPAIVYGSRQDFQSFYTHEIALRQKYKFPPFTHILKLTCTYKTEATAIRNAREMAKILKDKLPQNVAIQGPAPAFYEFYKGTYRWQITVKATKRQNLLDAIKLVPKTHWQIDIDPIGLI
jgi:primosomal protein N' (replication factor Y)